MEAFTEMTPLPNSLYMELINKGKEEGLREGVQKGILETAWRLYLKGFDIELIMDITGLPKEEILAYIEKRKSEKK